MICYVGTRLSSLNNYLKNVEGLSHSCVRNKCDIHQNLIVHIDHVSENRKSDIPMSCNLIKSSTSIRLPFAIFSILYLGDEVETTIAMSK